MATPNLEQRAAWDGEEGDRWTEHEERYEASARRHGGERQVGVTQFVDSPDLLAQRIDEELRTAPNRSTAALRKVRRRWSARLRDRPAQDVTALSLAIFERHDQRWIAYELLLFHPSALELIDQTCVERLAGELRSWGDVDQFGVLLAGPAWRAGRIDDGVVHGWAQRPDRWWRRAALVATVPLNVRSRGGRGDAQRTFAVCELLLDDRDDMVTKAMSWALRELVVHDRRAVEAFLATHSNLIAPRVRREVRSKLTTGLKRSLSGSGGAARVP